MLKVNKKKKQSSSVDNSGLKPIEFDVIIKEEPKSREPSPILIDNDRDEELTSVQILQVESAVQSTDSQCVNTNNSSIKLFESSKNDKHQIPNSCSPEKNTAELSRSPLEQFERNHLKSPFNFKVNRNRSRSPQRDFFYNKYFDESSMSPRCRPPSPLGINTEVLNTITMAPLSPRSAAFVLQNREILAKRKMSPRRSTSRSTEFSVSRSPTPRRRSLSRDRQSLRNRSLSPRRSVNSPSVRSYYSPKRSQPRSMSPKNRIISPLRRRSRSTSRNRFYSIKKRSPGHLATSHKKTARYLSPKRKSRSPIRKPIHSRLGFRLNTPKTCDKIRSVNHTRRKSHSDRSLSLSLSPSPEHIVSTKDESQSISSLMKQKDSVLEARKRKFENNIPIEPAGGVIKLKLKSDSNEFENSQRSNEVICIKQSNESVIESDSEFIEMNPTIDDLWSSEESESENEGRFKMSKLNDGIGSGKSKLSCNVDKIRSNRNLTGTQKVSNMSFSKRVTSMNKSRRYDKNYKNKSRSPFSNRYKIDKLDTISDNRKEKLDKREIKSTKIISEIKNKNLQKSLVHEKVNDKIYNSAVYNEKDQTKNSFGNRSISLETRPKMESQIIDENDKIQIKQDDAKKDETNINKVIISKDENPVPEKNVSRKVTEISVKPVDSNEPEIIYEDEEEKNDEEGDLRAELSRRRAQRRAVNVISVNASHGPPTRILQNAFQEMSKKQSLQLPKFSRPNKVSKQEIKLPVRLRLGLPEDELQVPKEESFLSPYYKETTDDLTGEELIHMISPAERKRNHVRGNRKKRINLQV